MSDELRSDVKRLLEGNARMEGRLETIDERCQSHCQQLSNLGARITKVEDSHNARIVALEQSSWKLSGKFAVLGVLGMVLSGLISSILVKVFTS